MDSCAIMPAFLTRRRSGSCSAHAEQLCRLELEGERPEFNFVRSARPSVRGKKVELYSSDKNQLAGQLCLSVRLIAAVLFAFPQTDRPTGENSRERASERAKSSGLSLLIKHRRSLRPPSRQVVDYTPRGATFGFH